MLYKYIYGALIDVYYMAATENFFKGTKASKLLSIDSIIVSLICK